MGQEIQAETFCDATRKTFRERLRQETATLKTWFDDRRFDEDDGPTIGLELEGWLVDENGLPSPKNDAFFEAAADPDIVAELSKFNFELNAPPQRLTGRVFKQTLADLTRTWTTCCQAAEGLKANAVAIGILPMVRDEMLQLPWMSESKRYRAMNQEVFRHRNDKPLHILIDGRDTLDFECTNLMLEAACTSLQAHLKVNQDDAVRAYNAAVLGAGPLVAATANSPFLYGRALWEETRIPTFEQATAIDGFRDDHGRNVLRVTLGTGYVHETLLELFVENLSYPDLLPALEDDRRKLPHLRLQNGTVWRWVRPILGFDDNASPHLRLEHRVMPAGPTLIDTVANLALCHGLVLALSKEEIPPESLTPFEDARSNFYACARHGLKAHINWAGKVLNVQGLLLEELLPKAHMALADLGVDAADLNWLFHEVLDPRIRSGRTGAAWQRAVIASNQANFQDLTERYIARQQSGAPVHTWSV